MTTDIIITTYKPDESLVSMVDAWASQSVSVNKIIICNKEEKYFDRLLFNGRFMENHKNVEVFHTSAREFDCGKTRNQAVRHSEADLVLFLEQGVMPEDGEVIAGLSEPFRRDPAVALSYARLIPKDSCGEGDKLIYAYFYPEESAVRTVNDIGVMGYRTCLVSNACAMYRRKVFETEGGFENHIIAGEGIIFGNRLLKEGYKAAYVSGAVARTDTRMSAAEARGTCFDLAVLFAMHPEIFDVREIRSEGRRLFKNAYHEISKQSRFAAYRYNRLLNARRSGFKKGRYFRQLPPKVVADISFNREFWRAEELMKARGAVNSREGYGRSKEELDMLYKNPIKAHDWDSKNPSDQ